MNREHKLLQLVELLWSHVPGEIAVQIADHCHRCGMGWALPPDSRDNVKDELMTAEEIGERLGYATSTIRGWVQRYDLVQYGKNGGLFRLSDIETTLRVQELKPKRKPGPKPKGEAA